MVWAALAAGTAAGVGAQPKLPKPPRSGDVRPLAPERGKGRDRGGDDVPPAYRPPPGMCRVWLDNVAPAQQPAPTDCNSAVRNRPANARVLFGDDYAAAGLGPVQVAAAPATVAAPTLASRWAPSVRFVGARVHGPSADEAPADFAVDSAPRAARAGGRRAVQPPAARPVVRPVARRAAADERYDRYEDVGGARAGAAPARDDWEAGYAAGYRDAVNGRRPRVRGADRGDPAPGAARGALRPDLRQPGDELDAGGGAGTPLVVVPGGTDVDPRYFNNGRNPPPGRANGVCLDRDADGWCDDPRFGAPVCRDLDGDGRCDDYPALAAAPLPAELPEMRAGLDVRGGAGSATALRWLGTSEVIARVTGAGRGGAPSRVVWLDANTGALVQVWTDRDGDGVADRVELYRNGRRTKLVGR
jgi:hypothetical protein